MSERTNLRRNPFLTRKRKYKKKKDVISSAGKTALSKYNTNESWYAGNKETPTTQTSKQAVPSSSRKKLVNYRISSDSESSDDEDDSEWEDISSSDEEEPVNYNNDRWVINIENLEQYMCEKVVCKFCSMEMYWHELTQHRAGLATKLQLRCKNNECETNADIYSEHGFFTTKKSGKTFEINRKSVLASRAIGKGRSGLNKFCSVLGLTSPVNQHSFTDYTAFWERTSHELLQKSINAAARRAKNVVLEENSMDSDTSIVDVPTCFDGSWSTRGWVAKKGIVAAIAENTGQVIDVVYKVNSCRECDKMNERRNKGEIDTLAYLTWYVKHEPNCFYNHDGSPQKMESDGVMELFKRSISLHGIRYNPYIGDGDSSSYSAVDKARPYGPMFLVVKSECVNHVTKRMGTNLRALIREYKGKKLADGKGLTGKGRLTLARCDAIQNFYGRAIRDNPQDPTAMSRSTWAILDHYSSTAEEPKHDKCPTGETSWCSFQRDRVTGQTTYKPVKWPFSKAVLDALKPLFERLASVEFLEGCRDCKTQNPNEALNHIIWSYAPKEQYISPMETSLAINLAVCMFNNGMEETFTNVFQAADIEISETMQNQWTLIDHKRIKQSDYVAREDRKLKRKLRKRALIKRQDAFQHIEGVQYQSQSFYSSTPMVKSKGRGRGRGRGRGKK